MRLIIDYLVYLAVRFLICAIQAMPMEVCEWLANRAPWVLYHKLKIRRKVIDESLEIAFGNETLERREEIALGMWRHLILMVCEIAHAYRKVHETSWRKHVSLPQKREVVRLMISRRPLIVLSGHFGNFEFGGYILALLGVPTYTVARDLDNPFLHDLVKRFRESRGQFVLPKTGSSSAVEGVLANRGRLALLGDQHAGPKGCWVDFMGRPASCHKAIALLGLGSKAPLAVLNVQRADSPLSFNIELEGALDPLSTEAADMGVKEITKWYSDQLAKAIRRAPEQYWWVHRRWREAPAKKAKVSVESTDVVPLAKAA